MYVSYYSFWNTVQMLQSNNKANMIQQQQKTANVTHFVQRMFMHPETHASPHANSPG